MFCKNCGEQIEPNSLFCTNCGSKVEVESTNTTKTISNSEPINNPNAGKKKCHIKLIAVVLLVMIVCAGVYVYRNFIRSMDVSDHLVYIKNNNMLLAEPSKYEPKEVTDDVTDYGGLNWDDGATSLLQCTGDGKYLVYVKNILSNDNSADLFYQKADGKNNKEEKIASDINWFQVSKDDETVLWTESNGSEQKIYYCSLKSKKHEKEKIDSTTQIIGMSKDLKNIVYMKDTALYVSKDMQRGEMICDEAENAYVTEADHSVEIYYVATSEGGKPISFSELIDDDCEAQDAAISEPNIKDYQSTRMVSGIWGPREEVVTDDSYNDALAKYEEKLSRDSLRQSLAEQTWTPTQKYIIYRNDDESTVVATITDTMYGRIYSDTAMMYYCDVDLDNIRKLKFSELLDVNQDELESRILGCFMSGSKLHYLRGTDDQVVKGMNLSDCQVGGLHICMNPKTEELYIAKMVQTYDEAGNYQENTGLYTYPCNDGNGEVTLLTDNTLRGLMNETAEGVYYMANADETGNVAELYLNGELVDTDVYPSFYGDGFEFSDNGILYLTDINSDQNEATLNLYNNGKSTKVADDVKAGSFCFVDEKNVAYLTNYDFDDHHGKLEVFNGKKNIDVDSKVNCIVFNYK
ncbi:MAG: zinc ribbon domain-containing protein [Lachnospiraceae bacterium]|nr:zinc ribbon domain-containing protein [Lachnospiraceae bacterium]